METLVQPPGDGFADGMKVRVFQAALHAEPGGKVQPDGQAQGKGKVVGVVHTGVRIQVVRCHGIRQRVGRV